MTPWDEIDQRERRWLQAKRRSARRRTAVLLAASVLPPALALLAWRARRRER